jgi:DNA-binding SARP family transcriptional activator
MPDQPVPEVVVAIRAADLASRGHTRRAVGLLEVLSTSKDDPVAWGLTKIVLAGLRLRLSQLDQIRALVHELDSCVNLPPVIANVASGFRVIVDTHDGGSLSDASEVLEHVAREHARAELHHYAAVSYHNAALVAFARGRYDPSVRLARTAIDHFNRTKLKIGVESTQVLAAQGMWELGEVARAREFLVSLNAGQRLPTDAQTDAAWIAAATGDTDRAWVLIEEATRAVLDANSVPSETAGAQYARVLAHLVDGNLHAARRELVGAQENSIELDAIERHAAMTALVALAGGDRAEAMAAVREGQAIAARHGASHWLQWYQLLAAVAEQDADGYRRSILCLTSSAKLSTLVLADAIALGFAMCPDLPEGLVELIRGWPKRWLPVLRRVTEGGDRQAGTVAAELLATFGTLDDVPVLSKFERKHIRQPGRRVLSRRLARHANPTMVVHDLGRIRLQLGPRVLPLSQSRRKAASLVAFLASRPSHSAARDQVLDAIWPNQAPAGAANSLHQTLFFLRRDIDPWFEDGHSVDYLVVEPDVVYLDPELVQVDSAAFFRQASAALASDNIADVALPILRDYPAKFALDFEYEEWSFAWRDQLHGLFLETTEAAADALLAAGRVKAAIGILERAIAVDPSSLDLEATLVRALHRSGAIAAAAHQYRHYSRAYRDEYGTVPPELGVGFAMVESADDSEIEA